MVLGAFGKKQYFCVVKNKKIKNHITEGQRYEIMSYLKVGLCPAEIARLIDKDRSVVCREIKRNKNRHGRYIASQAQESADMRKERFSSPRKLFPWVKREIVRLLTEEQWSPKQICGWMKRKGMEWVSHETIYKLIREDKARGGDLYRHLRHKGKHRRRPVGKSIPIRNRVGIEERPGVVDRRDRFGDWEMDTIVGRNGIDAIVVLTERLTRFTMMARSPRGKNAEAVADTVINLLLPYKSVVHTITTDNGTEFAEHERIASRLDAKIYFAHPYSSWEKGLVENTNKLIRQYIPKKSVLCDFSDDFIHTVQLKLNRRPREKLDFESPKNKFFIYLQ